MSRHEIIFHTRDADLCPISTPSKDVHLHLFSFPSFSPTLMKQEKRFGSIIIKILNNSMIKYQKFRKTVSFKSLDRKALSW